MNENHNSAEDLKSIRKIMEESSRFLSLSGLSGVFAGTFAIAGALIAKFLILKNGTISYDEYFRGLPATEIASIKWQLVFVALGVLFLSISCALWFSARKAKVAGSRLWSPVSKRLLVNMMIPLISGGLFVAILFFQNNLQLIVPALLIFYGLALVNAGKFTYGEVFYLGLLQLLTGFISAFFPSLVLIFWTIGFGLFHIVYGLFMYRKYEA